MFLNIPDSVMISHIYLIDVLLGLQVSVEMSLPWNRCLKQFKRSLELSHLFDSYQRFFFGITNV